MSRDCFWVFQSFPSYDAEEKCQLAAGGFKWKQPVKSIWLIGSAAWFRWASTMVILLHTGQMLHSKWWGLGLKILSAGTKRKTPLRLEVTWQTDTQRNKRMLNKNEKSLPEQCSHLSIWVTTSVFILFLIEREIFKSLNSTWTYP